MNPICPSILSTTFFNLESKLTTMAAAGIEVLHLDVMDGHFVDTISFGPLMLTALRPRFQFQYDCHLMVKNPGKQIPFFLKAGANWISIHAETETEHIAANLAVIRAGGCKAGLALNPDTPVDRAWPYLGQLDYVLLMSVFPGYGGQTFIPATLERVAALRARIASTGARCRIQVDGGINSGTIASLKKAGADLYVIGTFLYNSESIAATVHEIGRQL
jgi:ribulose-phosphate 3-epimerase